MIEATHFWEGLREQTDPFFANMGPNAALWRLSLPSITEPLPGTQLMEWGGSQRWWITDTEAQWVRMTARQAGGHATLFRAGPDNGQLRQSTVFTPLSAPLMKIHRGLKAAFDPARIFNRGRLYPDF